jgi:hypothetical protein
MGGMLARLDVLQGARNVWLRGSAWKAKHGSAWNLVPAWKKKKNMRSCIQA